jgi:hypothetical protein
VAADFWSAPTLTPDQEMRIGEEVARHGRDSFLREHHPYLGEDEQAQLKSVLRPGFETPG